MVFFHRNLALPYIIETKQNYAKSLVNQENESINTLFDKRRIYSNKTLKPTLNKQK
jgi:hypothetical protein